MRYAARAKIDLSSQSPQDALTLAGAVLTQRAEQLMNLGADVRLVAGERVDLGAELGLAQLSVDALLEQLPHILEEQAGRQPSLHLTLRGFRWRGTPEDTTGELRVMTFWAPRIVAPTVQAWLLGETDDVRSLKKTFASIKRSTGFEFVLERTFAAPGEEITPERRAILEVCLCEAIARTRPLVAGSIPQPLPHLYDDRGAAGDVRSQAIMDGRRERLNADTYFRQLMRPRGFTVRKAREAAVFTRALTTRLELAVVFEKIHHFGLGKSFQVLLALTDAVNAHDKAVRPIAREDITAMFLDWRPNRFPRTWAYADSNELSAALDAIGHVLDLVLEPLERELRALLDPLPATLPEQVSRRPYVLLPTI